MKCPECGGASSVSDTRGASSLTTSRRRECVVCSLVFKTREIHEPVFCSAKPRAANFAATVQARIQLRARDIQIAQSLHQGWMAVEAAKGMERSAIYVAAKRGRQHLTKMKRRG